MNGELYKKMAKDGLIGEIPILSVKAILHMQSHPLCTCTTCDGAGCAPIGFAIGAGEVGAIVVVCPDCGGSGLIPYFCNN